MSDLKLLANDILDKLNRHGDFPNDIKPHMKKAKELAREVNESNTQDEAVRSMLSNNAPSVEAPEPPVEETPEVVMEASSSMEEAPEPVEEVQMEEVPDPVAETPVAEEQDAPQADETPVDSEEENKGSFFDQFD